MPPAVQRGGGELQSEVGIQPDLAVFGQMVSVFVYHYLREHVGADVVATDDRMRRLDLVYAWIGRILVGFHAQYGTLYDFNPYLGRFAMEYAGNILADDVAFASSHTFGHHDGCAFLKSCVPVARRTRRRPLCACPAFAGIGLYLFGHCLYLGRLFVHRLFDMRG